MNLERCSHGQASVCHESPMCSPSFWARRQHIAKTTVRSLDQMAYILIHQILVQSFSSTFWDAPQVDLFRSSDRRTPSDRRTTLSVSVRTLWDHPLKKKSSVSMPTSSCSAVKAIGHVSNASVDAPQLVLPSSHGGHYLVNVSNMMIMYIVILYSLSFIL